MRDATKIESTTTWLLSNLPNQIKLSKVDSDVRFFYCVIRSGDIFEMFFSFGFCTETQKKSFIHVLYFSRLYLIKYVLFFILHTFSLQSYICFVPNLYEYIYYNYFLTIHLIYTASCSVFFWVCVLFYHLECPRLSETSFSFYL